VSKLKTTLFILRLKPTVAIGYKVYSRGVTVLGIVNYKDTGPSFYKKYMEAGVLTFVTN